MGDDQSKEIDKPTRYNNNNNNHERRNATIQHSKKAKQKQPKRHANMFIPIEEL